MATAALLLAPAGAALAQPVTITVWGIDNQTGSGDPGPTQIMADEWNAANDEVRIEYRFVAFDDLNPDYQRAIATNTAPDIFMVNTTDTQFYAAQGLVIDLSDRVAASEVIDADEIFPGYLEAVTYEGRIYEVPRASDTIAIYYNVDMLEAAGIDPAEPPESWAQLYDYAERLTDPAARIHGIAFSARNNQQGPWQWLPFARMAGAEFDNINAPGGVRALTLWRDFVQNGLASREVLVWAQTDAADTFRAGSAAMVIQGNWDLPQMEHTPFEWGLWLLPPEEEGGLRVSAAGNFTYGITTTSQHPDEAFAFIEYAYSQQHRNWNEFQLLPPRPIEIEDPRFPEAYELFLRQLEFGRVLGPHPRWNDVSIVLQEAIQTTLAGQADPQAALDQAAARIEALGE